MEESRRIRRKRRGDGGKRQKAHGSQGQGGPQQEQGTGLQQVTVVTQFCKQELPKSSSSVTERTLLPLSILDRGAFPQAALRKTISLSGLGTPNTHGLLAVPGSPMSPEISSSMKMQFCCALQKLSNQEDDIQHSQWCFLLTLEIVLWQCLLYWRLCHQLP